MLHGNESTQWPLLDRTPLYMCLIETWGMLRGVSRSVEGADWLALYVPVTHPGLAF